MDFNEFMESLNHVFAEPFQNYYEGKQKLRQFPSQYFNMGWEYLFIIQAEERNS